MTNPDNNVWRGILYEEVGKRMRARRVELDLQIKDLAKHLGIGAVSLQQIETGKSCPLHVLVAFARHTKTPYEALIPSDTPNLVPDRTERPTGFYAGV